VSARSKWVGTPSPRQLPIRETALPSVYWAASGWGIRLEEPDDIHSAMAPMSLPPEHWRETVLRILHLTEGHDPDPDDQRPDGACPLCEKIAAVLLEVRP